MDSQIGSDIAKLLGSIGKTEAYGAPSASDSEAGMAFKRTLAASVQAQTIQKGGNGLPAASESEQAVLPAPAGASEAAATAHRKASAEHIATTVLPEFDLHVVGAPVERIAMMKLAEETILSEDALAQLFASAGGDSALLQFEGNELAEAIAGAIAQWIDTQQKQGNGLFTDESLQHDEKLAHVEGNALSKLITPEFEIFSKPVEASPTNLVEQLAGDIEPVLQDWLVASSRQVDRSSASVSQLSESIVDVVKPSIALWLDSQSGESKRADVSIDALAQKIVRTITLEVLSVSAFTTAELKASPAEWIATGAVSGRQADQLGENIARQMTQALPALGEATAASSSLTGQVSSIASVGLEGVSETQLRAVRDTVLSRPQPITLTVVDSEVDSGRATQQSLANALAQVIAPASRPATEALVLTQPAATLDRFALRGVGLRSDGVDDMTKAISNLNTDGLKAGKVDSVAALRELISARSFELARLASSGEKPLVAAREQQTPFAGMTQGDVVDAAAARPAGSSELSLRQSLASADRALINDAGRLNQFTPNQNLAARDLASRHLSEALGQRLAANIAAGHYRLTFNVNPRELGAIDVVMEMRDGRLDAQINASNAVTRDLLGDSLPRLRDALQQSGINLAQLQVGSESQQGNAQGRRASDEQSADQGQEEIRLADMSDDLVSEDLELGLDLDSVDFWA